MLATRNSIKIAIDIQEELNTIEPKKTSLHDFYELPSSSQFNCDHQLWSPFVTANISEDTPIESVPSKTIEIELKKYYSRSSTTTSLYSNIIHISARALLNSHVYSSIMYRRVKQEIRRGNHFILFHVAYNS